MANNIKNSVLAYPKHLYKSPTHIRDGFRRVLNAHNIATAEMRDVNKRHFHNLPGVISTKYKELKEKGIEKYNNAAGGGGGGGGVKPATKPVATHH